VLERATVPCELIDAAFVVNAQTVYLEGRRRARNGPPASAVESGWPAVWPTAARAQAGPGAAQRRALGTCRLSSADGKEPKQTGLLTGGNATSAGIDDGWNQMKRLKENDKGRR